MPFTDRSILVTGAASGIGLATARHLAGQGAARLILADIDAAALARVDVGCTVHLAPGDVRDEGYWHDIAHLLVGLDHAVINAGIAGAGRIVDQRLDDWRRILSVNLDGAYLSLRAAMTAMQARGGSIVATASAGGIKPEPGTSAYGASKAGLIHLVKVAAKEGAADRIRVNAIAPAGVETPMWDAVPMFAERAAAIGRDAAFAELAAMATPLGRYATAEEIAGQIAFLLSDAAATITGTVLVSDGGYVL